MIHGRDPIWPVPKAAVESDVVAGGAAELVFSPVGGR